MMDVTFMVKPLKDFRKNLQKKLFVEREKSVFETGPVKMKIFRKNGNILKVYLNIVLTSLH